MAVKVWLNAKRGGSVDIYFQQLTKNVLTTLDEKVKRASSETNEISKRYIKKIT